MERWRAIKAGIWEVWGKGDCDGCNCALLGGANTHCGPLSLPSSQSSRVSTHYKLISLGSLAEITHLLRLLFLLLELMLLLLGLLYLLGVLFECLLLFLVVWGNNQLVVVMNAQGRDIPFLISFSCALIGSDVPRRPMLLYARWMRRSLLIE